MNTALHLPRLAVALSLCPLIFPIPADADERKPPAATVHLSCPGQGMAPTVTTGTAQAIGKDERGTGPHVINSIVPSPFSATLEVKLSLEGDTYRVQVKPPKDLVPWLRSDNDNGWFPLRDVALENTVLKGRLRLNYVTRPKFSLDRRTGDVRLEGSERFSGVCVTATSGPALF